MHQVYDDDMTFKLVAAASTVSGLPVEVCLEEFGKHFLIYCQKNGYDQILRVLGSNLYDFLTNLDNLHDHLASIYPGMRAPSFRVTRYLNKNTENKIALPKEEMTQALLKTSDELHKENASCSLGTGSMYLHYYSDRAGLSPIVKGLVMAVAREFFQTNIQVTEVIEKHSGSAGTGADKTLPLDDHVVLKIDRKEPETEASQEALEVEEEAAEEARQLEGETRNKSHSADGGKHQMLNIYDSLSTNFQDSLVNSEIMMQTFPFHVIFDRQFNLVQVGKSLLRVTSLYWQRHQAGLTVLLGSANSADNQSKLVATELIKFSDLFKIMRPKIEFTFDAIADHTNQVFVVKTKPLVLNADYNQQKRASASSAGSTSSSSSTTAAKQRPAPPLRPVCPMDRIAMEARRKGSVAQRAPQEPNGQPPESVQPPPAPAQVQEALSEEPSENYLSLRLKGQMIILLGGELCLFLCSPRVDHLDQLLECGVKMSDFALHDRARELMLMSHTHKEDRETVKKLDQASNDLKKMDTKLRLENKRTNEVLHNIFPAKIASLLSHGLKVESESFDLVTCLYSDIIGFTKMCGSENVKPIDIVRLLNKLYLQFDNLTTIHGVFKVETIGDAYVIVGGLPEPAPDHADRCVKMGLDMVKVIKTVVSPADNQPIQMRIGIHSGPVMAGIVGIRVPRYSLFGNTTTLANQLETNGVGGKIHISDFTLKNLINRERFVIEDNPTEINGILRKTYFVTDYLRDEHEKAKYEKFLQEQLIKDFELMGNELELVDDNNNSSSTTNVQTVDTDDKQAPMPGSSVGDLQDPTTAIINDNEPTSSIIRKMSLNASMDLPSLAAAKLGSHHQLPDSEQQRPAAKQVISNNKSGRLFGEKIASSQITDADLDRLILMDIEGSSWSADNNNNSNNNISNSSSNNNNNNNRSAKLSNELRLISGQLSEAIISDALGELARNSGRVAALLKVGGQQCSYELILKQRNVANGCDDSKRPAEIQVPSSSLERPEGVGQFNGRPYSDSGAEPIIDQSLESALVAWLKDQLSMAAALVPRPQHGQLSAGEAPSGRTQAGNQERNNVAHLNKEKPTKEQQQLAASRRAYCANCFEATGGDPGGDFRLKYDEFRSILEERRRSSIEREICELRSEKFKLEEQLERLRQETVKAAVGGRRVQLSPNSSSFVTPPVSPSPSPSTLANGGHHHHHAAAAKISPDTRIEKIRRMDTLKRRKMKKQESNSSSTNSFELSPISPSNMARFVSEEDSEEEEPEMARKGLQFQRQGTSGTSNKLAIEEEQEEDFLEAGEYDEHDQQDENNNLYIGLEPTSLKWSKVGDKLADEPIKRIDQEPLGLFSVDIQLDVHKQQTAKLNQPQNSSQQSRRLSYQNVRLSLASIVQDVANSTRKRSRLFSNLDSLTNIFSSSPFSSPIKRPSSTATTASARSAASSTKETNANQNLYPAGEDIQDRELRKYSSSNKSQSSGMNSDGGGLSPRLKSAGHNNGDIKAKHGSTCFCLGKSESNRSLANETK